MSARATGVSASYRLNPPVDDGRGRQATILTVTRHAPETAGPTIRWEVHTAFPHNHYRRDLRLADAAAVEREYSPALARIIIGAMTAITRAVEAQERTAQYAAAAEAYTQRVGVNLDRRA